MASDSRGLEEEPFPSRQGSPPPDRTFISAPDGNVLIQKFMNSSLTPNAVYFRPWHTQLQENGSPEDKWATYLEKYGFFDAFEELQGTVRKRFNYVVDAKIKEVLEVAEQANAGRVQLPPVRRDEDPFARRLSSPEARENLLVRNGVTYLKNLIESDPPCQPQQQYPPGFLCSVMTRYGLLSVLSVLYKNSWYMGQRPGTPIFKIHYVNSQALSLDEHLANDHQFEYQGIVPYSRESYRRRFEDKVFPAFMSIVFAVLCFDIDREYQHRCITSLMETGAFEVLLQCWTGNSDIPDPIAGDDEERARLDAVQQRPTERTADKIKDYLQDIVSLWMRKYGNSFDSHALLPPFAQHLLATKTRSRLGETAWLAMKIMTDPKGENSASVSSVWPVLRRCITLLQAMTGESVQNLALAHSRDFMGADAYKQLQEADADYGRCRGNILIYGHTRLDMDIHTFYDPDDQPDHYRHIDSELPVLEEPLRRIKETAERILSRQPLLTLPELPTFAAASREPLRSPSPSSSRGLGPTQDPSSVGNEQSSSTPSQVHLSRHASSPAHENVSAYTGSRSDTSPRQ